MVSDYIKVKKPTILPKIPKEIIDYWKTIINDLNFKRSATELETDLVPYGLCEFKSELDQKILISINIWGDDVSAGLILFCCDSSGDHKFYVHKSNIYNEKEMLRILKMKVLW